MKKLLLTLMCLLAATLTGRADPTHVDLSFDTIGAKNPSTGNNWTSSYNQTMKYSTSEVDVVISNVAKQTGTITTVPVAKNGSVTVTFKKSNDEYVGTFKSFTFNFTQWSTKTNTATLQYSTDGTNFNDFNPAISASLSSSTLSVSATTIPEGVVAIKMATTNSNNQIGYASFDYEKNLVGDPTICEKPKFSPAGGNLFGASTVSISCDTEDATIHYSINDGAEQVYSSPIQFEEDGTYTVKAYASKDGLDNSDIATAEYIYAVNLPLEGYFYTPSEATYPVYATQLMNQSGEVGGTNNTASTALCAVTGGFTSNLANITFSSTDGSNFAYINKDNTLSIYSNNKFTISVPEVYEITGIEFNQSKTTLTADCGTFTNGKWTKSNTDVSKVVFTYTGSAWTSSCISTIKVTYKEKVVKTPITLAWSEDYAEGLELVENATATVAAAPTDAELENPVVIEYTSSNTSVATIDKTSCEIKALVPGTTEITATLAANEFYTAEDIKFTLTVKKDDSFVEAIVAKYNDEVIENNAVVNPRGNLALYCATEGAVINYVLTGPADAKQEGVWSENIAIVEVGDYTLTATASKDGLKDATLNLNFKVEKPTIQDVIEYVDDNNNTFGFTGSYSLRKYESPTTGIVYYGKGLKNKGLQVNSTVGSTKSGNKSGIISEENKLGYSVSSINITGTTLDDKTVVKFSNTKGTHTGDIEATGAEAYVEGASNGVDATSVKNEDGSYTFTPTDGKTYKFFAITTTANQIYTKIIINYDEPTTPVQVPVTLSWDVESVQHVTVGDKIEATLSVEPAEAREAVNVYNFNPQNISMTYDKATGKASLEFIKELTSEQAAIISAYIEEGNADYEPVEANLNFMITAKPIEIIEPGKVVSDPATDEDDAIYVKVGDKITFSSENAAKLMILFEDESIETVSNPYVFTVTDTMEITVYPVDENGEEYRDAEGNLFQGKELDVYIMVDDDEITDWDESTFTFNFKDDAGNSEYTYEGTSHYFEYNIEIPPMRMYLYDYSSTMEYEEGIGYKIANASASDNTIANSAFFTSGLPEMGYIITNVELIGQGIDEDTYIYDNESNYIEFYNFNDIVLEAANVTFSHERVAIPDGKIVRPADSWEGAKLHLSHSKGHNIYYRILNASANAPMRANTVKTDHEGYTLYTEPIDVNEYTQLEVYAVHPHGMTSTPMTLYASDVETSVSTIELDATEDVYFNLQGVRVANPAEGTYIRIANGKATKVIVK